MNQVLPGLSDDQILAKIAQRAACLHRAAKIDVDDQNAQFTKFVEEYRAKPEVAEIIDDPTTADVRAEMLGRLAGLVQEQFVYAPSREVQESIDEWRNRGYGIIPQNISSDKWGPDTCDCKLHRVSDGVDQQTYVAAPCEFHAGQSIDQIHDKVHEENRRRMDFLRELQKLDPAFAVENIGGWKYNADRVLVVDATRESPETVTTMRALLLRAEFRSKVIVNG